ncbi:MAG: hypothetical protein KBC96_10665 [Armatimonadetes bacterium]|nr:hypothetical protein [Armatimonadota bacterium]
MGDYDDIEDEDREEKRRRREMEDDEDALTFVIADEHARQWREAHGGSCCLVPAAVALALALAAAVLMR